MRNVIHIQRVIVAPIAIVLAALILFACAGSSAAVIATPTTTPTSVSTPGSTATPSTTPIGGGIVYLHVESTPAGATVRTGIQYVNNISAVTTGRVVGVSPLTVELHPTDVAQAPASSAANLVTLLRFPGYYDNLVVMNLGPGGALEPGRTYTISAKLMPLPTTKVLPHPQGAPSVL
jgi:hypothetical protein